MKLVLMSFAIFAAGATAALPPYWHRVNEYKAVLDSQEVNKIVTDAKYASSGAGIIESVEMTQNEKTGVAFYTVYSGKCELKVTIKYPQTKTPVSGAATPVAAPNTGMLCQN